MKIGYARVSTPDQKLDLQIDALTKAGCEKIFSEKQSAIKHRPEFELLKNQLREGDTLIVWKLDRIGRSMKDLVNLIGQFQDMKIDFVSLQDNVDTCTPQGRLFFNIMASLAEFEREIIRERTMAGLAAARERGRTGGRPKGLSEENLRKAKAAKQLYESTGDSTAEIAKTLGISRTTLYRYLHLLNVKVGV